MSNNKINKSTLKEAKEQFEEIQKFAIDEATKNLKEDVSKKVIELMNSFEDENPINEEVTINTDGATIKIDDEGNVEVEPENKNNEIDSLENEDEDEAEEILVSDEDDEIEIDDLDEMNLEEITFEEQEAPMTAPAPEAAQEPEVAPEPAPAPASAEADTSQDVVSNPFQALMDKLDQLMAVVGGNAEGENDEIEIIDDTEAMAASEPTPEGMPAPAPAPAPTEAPAPMAEEITFEVVNDMEDDDEVLEIVGETEYMEEMDEELEEVKMMGQSHTVQKTTGTSAGPDIAIRNRERLALRESAKNTAQNEAKLAELIKENESLKLEKENLESELEKFEGGFLKLQENFGKMQDYNAKLVMAYRVAMSGGLTTDEKVQISEQFDNCETIEEAEKLYKSIVSENKIKVNNNPEKGIKSTSIKTTPAKSVSQPLYESAEAKRMKQLAGIKENQG